MKKMESYCFNAGFDLFCPEDLKVLEHKKLHSIIKLLLYENQKYICIILFILSFILRLKHL